MSNTSRRKRQKRTDRVNNMEIDERETGFDAIFIPEMDDSGDSDSNSDLDTSDDSDSHAESEFVCDIPSRSYTKILADYEEDQAKLEPEYIYRWADGEWQNDGCAEDDILLPDKTKKMIRSSSPVQLFELFFSKELKQHIVDATNANGCNLKLDELDVFLGIIVLSIFNQRKSQKDFWSKDPLLRCEPVVSAMSRDRFLKLKSSIKMSKSGDRNPDDKAWKVRKVLDIFRKNAMQFGHFSTALSVDEMMVGFHGRTGILQFMANKPERFGIKFWGFCSSSGYLFNWDIYCGKGSNIYSSDGSVKLNKCAVGSRVVLKMAQYLLTSIVPRKIFHFHLYFDNFFTSPDLLVHLKKLGLRATGTVRTNRVKVTNEVNKKAERGTYSVKHEEGSGMNFITVMDSKPVSILSTMAGVTPLSSVSRFSKQKHAKADLPFPSAFTLYNKYMGGVDLHDFHCSKLKPSLRAKKWTWVIFLRIIQASITNATVIWNLVCPGERTGTKEVGLEIARSYLAKASLVTGAKPHRSAISGTKKQCVNFHKCAVRTQKVCESCNVYLCSTCFTPFHEEK